MTRRLTERQIVRILNAFNLEEKVAEFLAGFAPFVWENEDVPRSRYRWALLTPYGVVKVLVNPYRTTAGEAIAGDWIHCLLDEYERAGPCVQAYHGCGGYHWKWNIYAFVGPCHGLRDAAEVERRLHCALESFKRGVWRLFMPAYSCLAATTRGSHENPGVHS
jgi:hypothetical protein